MSGAYNWDVNSNLLCLCINKRAAEKLLFFDPLYAL